MNLANLRYPCPGHQLLISCVNKCDLFSFLDKGRGGAVWGQAPQVFVWAPLFVDCAKLCWERGKGRSSHQMGAAVEGPWSQLRCCQHLHGRNEKVP